MKIVKQQSLTREQKESIALLQIGTFLEYFDLMLYVHMAVLLNELFFPKTDPLTARLIGALSFSSVFILRPFGAIIFGYIGDNFGRKLTVIITTILMAVSCIIMYILPTYNEIGFFPTKCVNF
jgi:MFS transporter, MHS family, proline/betaine transporter